jgi:hypothetical protein
LVIRTPISNPSQRSYLYLYATLQMEPIQAETSGSKIVCYVEADARTGEKGFIFWCGVDLRAKMWWANRLLIQTRFFPVNRKAPFGFESLPPLAPSSAILQEIDRLDPSELDSSK